VPAAGAAPVRAAQRTEILPENGKLVSG